MHDANYSNTMVCNLNYSHKSYPSPEDVSMTECLPFRNRSCCHGSTVKDKDTINQGYGDAYRWVGGAVASLHVRLTRPRGLAQDRCGALSQPCERFFVQEACFYECDPNAGLCVVERLWQPSPC
jgi:folate receptor